jgi:hypothetical protein
MSTTSPRHPHTGRFVPDRHALGRALVAQAFKPRQVKAQQQVKLAQAPALPTGIRKAK